jgi:hypothetical protein
MPKRSSKAPGGDLNTNAFRIVQQVISQAERIDAHKAAHEKAKEKNPAAVALGRLGGLKGGKARAEKLTPQQRTEIAKKAAKERWKD